MIGIGIATVLLIPMPFFFAMLVFIAEGLLYGLYILGPSRAGRQLQHRRRRGLDR
jgi:hypothetical protein